MPVTANGRARRPPLIVGDTWRQHATGWHRVPSLPWLSVSAKRTPEALHTLLLRLLQRVLIRHVCPSAKCRCDQSIRTFAHTLPLQLLLVRGPQRIRIDLLASRR